MWYGMPEIILIMAGKQYSGCNLCCSTSVNEFITFMTCSFLILNFIMKKEMLVYGSIGAAVLNIILNGLLIPIFDLLQRVIFWLSYQVLYSVCIIKLLYSD